MSVPALPQRRSEAHQQRLLEAHAAILAQTHPVLSQTVGAKPAGLLNQGNTCFLNSTFQALAATTQLIDLVSPVIFPPPTATTTTATPTGSVTVQQDEPQVAEQVDGQVVQPPAVPSLLPDAHPTGTAMDGLQLTSQSIPSLLEEALEPDNSKLLPVALTFEKCLGKAWRAKDDTLVTREGVEKPESERNVSLKALLYELGKKYDQYTDYQQQDAHELLRHLLDSMSMEERDLIKTLRPAPPKNAAGGPPTKRSRRRNPTSGFNDFTDPSGDGIAPQDRLVPFSDALFGGTLVSVVICEGCKSVSHTYEGFMDISLSMKNQQPRVRKRDKFKAVAQKLKIGGNRSPHRSPSDAARQPVFLEGVHDVGSETAADSHDAQTADESSVPRYRSASRSDAASKARSESAARYNSGSETPASGGLFGSKRRESQNESGNGNGFGLKKRSSLSSWTGRKRSSRPSTASSINSEDLHDIRSTSVAHYRTPSPSFSSADISVGLKPKPYDQASTPASSIVDSQARLPLDSALVAETMEEALNPNVPPKPRPEQAAYIRRLLNGPNLPPRASDDPLERLRNGMNQMQVEGSSPGVPISEASSMHGTDHAAASAGAAAIDGLDTDLMDSLKTFTSVEVLEGDNAFACHRCWRYKTGRGGKKHLRNKKHSETTTEREKLSGSSSSESDDERPAPSSSPSQQKKRVTMGATTEIKSSVPEIEVTAAAAQAHSAATSSENLAATQTPGSLAAALDARRGTMSSVETDRATTRSSNSGKSGSGLSGYKTSSEESSDDELPPASSQQQQPAGRLSVVRPPMPARRKSQHFVLQRAFKRYMIARSPPVLVFHFKRFQASSKAAASNMYSSSFAQLKKNNEYVSFPRVLDLSPFMAPDRSDYKIVMGEDGIGKAQYENHPVGDRGPELTPMRYKLYGMYLFLIKHSQPDLLIPLFFFLYLKQPSSFTSAPLP